MGQLLRRDETTGRWSETDGPAGPLLPRTAAFFLASFGAIVIAGATIALHRGRELKVKQLEIPQYQEGIVSRRELELRYEIDQANGDPDPDLKAALRQPPLVSRYESRRSGSSLTYTPLRPPKAQVKSVVHADLAICGSELETVTTAMAAAKRGLRVAMILDAPLGGVSSDEGANLRYLDTVDGVPFTESETELFKAIGVRGLVSVPTGVSEKIAAYLKLRYSAEITLAKCDSLDNLQIEAKGTIKSVTTDQGTKIVAKKFLDMDPECRFGERCGLPLSVKTPALAYGLVFDLKNLTPADYKHFRQNSFLSVDSLAGACGTDWKTVSALPGAQEEKERLITAVHMDYTRVLPDSSYGYSGLAEGYQFYMLCRQAAHDTPDLEWLNTRRLMSGFNIAHLGSEANFNSISYDINDVFLQHCHSIRRNPELKAIMNCEWQGLESYFQYVTGNKNLRVRLPDEFYVRRSTASIKTSSPYVEADFDPAQHTGWSMAYPMDFRGLTARHGFDDQLIVDIRSDAYKDRWSWKCRPSTCATKIANLAVLNKCAMPARYSGCLRIIQNLISTGQAWVELLPKPQSRTK